MKKILCILITLLVIGCIFTSCDGAESDETTALITEAIEMTAETTKLSETTVVPETTTSPETTVVSETTTTPETTAIPETTTAPETTVISETTTTPETTEPPHVHFWGDWITVLNATCTESGKQERSCECGEKENKVISASGHTEIKDEAVAATCTTAGKTEGKHCSVCNTVTVKQNTVKALGHKEVIDKAVAATCTTAGKTEGKHCSVCNIVTVKQNTVKALGHKEVTDKAVAATCTTAGKTEGKHCSVCNKIIKKQNQISKIPHAKSDWITDVEPTCTTTGSAHKECTMCGKNIQSKSLAKSAHIESNWIVDRESTCKSFGSQHIECITCKRKIKTQSIAKDPDNHTEVIDAAVAPTCLSEGLTEGKHCSACNAVLVEQTTIPNLDHTGTNVCTVCGEELIVPDEVWSEIGYITTEDTVIETKYFYVHLPANVYVPADMVENLDLIGEIMEKVSGMTSAGNSQYQYGSAKTPITVEKRYNPDDPDSEVFDSPYATTRGACIDPFSLIEANALIHESAHVFHFRQSNWRYCTWAMESISTYTTYKVQKFIEDNYPELRFYVQPSYQSISSMPVKDYSKLYEHTMEYWVENTFEYSYNNNYAIGFRLAWFLDEVYGDYTKWIYTYEELYPCYNNQNAKLSTEDQLKAFKIAYGDDVFDKFYAWLQNNEYKFERKDTLDIRTTHNIDLYPQFTAGTTKGYRLPYKNYEYSELYINLQPGKYYLSEYKNKNIDKLELTVSGGVTMSFYDSKGKMIKTVTSSGDMETFDISEVDFIKLVGSGTLYSFKRIIEDGSTKSEVLLITGY